MNQCHTERWSKLPTMYCLLEEFDISIEPIIYRKSKEEPEVVEHFIKTIVDISERIEE